MLRFLFAAAAVSALASPAMAQDAEVGKQYDITIATQESNQYVGAYGQVKIGEVLVMVPDAKVGEKYTVKITAVGTNQYTGNRQASCEFKQMGGDREGMCLAAP